MRDLPKYGSVKSCPKCGCSKETRWPVRLVPFGWAATEFRPYIPGDAGPKPAYMERTCNRCGYCWDEAPLDAEKPDA